LPVSYFLRTGSRLLTSLFDARPRTKAGKGLSGFHHTAALLMVVAVSATFAQTPPAPAGGASAALGAAQTSDALEAAEAMKRARRMAENPYRWIKIHADTKSKPETVKAEPAKPRAPTEPSTAEAPRPAPRPSVSAATAAALEATAPRAPAEVVTTMTPPPAEAPAPVPVAAPAVAVAAPASAPAPIQTASASPTPDDTDDVELKPISTPPPEFPRELRNSVTAGRVTVAFTVQADGTVGETSAESSTNRRLTRAALEAVKRWKFEPMTSAVTYKVEFDFKE